MTPHAPDRAFTLADRLAHPAPMTTTEVAGVGSQVAAELDGWHRGGTSHRGLGPQQIEVRAEPDGRLITRIQPPTSPPSPDDVRYRAPEQLTGRPVGPAADVYALGVVLLEGLLGHRHDPPAVPADLGAAWRYLLTGMIAASPADRPTAATVAHALSGVPGVAASPGLPAPAAPDVDAAPRSKLLPDGAHVEPVVIELRKPGRLARLRPPIPGRRRPPEPDTRGDDHGGR